MPTKTKKKQFSLKLRDVTDQSEGEPLVFITADGKKYIPDDLRELRAILTEKDNDEE